MFSCVVNVSYVHCVRLILLYCKCRRVDGIFVNDCICVILVGVSITKNRVLIKKAAHTRNNPNVRLLHIKKLRVELSDCDIPNDGIPV